jgi:hypothetical protein
MKTTTSLLLRDDHVDERPLVDGNQLVEGRPCTNATLFSTVGEQIKKKKNFAFDLSLANDTHRFF